ncbi:hypothetical protein QBC34DRAFT_410532 [Podospora aff. communis PSN243]|uniref:Histone chaperone domain-containing protein n=1 Tax=Podospora aff. communis PSN243 TaxID=3040156 RepID=A0AAV9GGA1_9PEZI|nr:hypothetical protein QBC34DRAFT_410532 [Podospora aff. communis PSN243]
MPTFRSDQFTKEETDMYVDNLAEDNLDGGNPFKQPANQTIADPDEAAMAAVLSRSLNEDEDDKPTKSEHQPTIDKAKEKSVPGTEETPSTVSDEPRFSGLFNTSEPTAQDLPAEETTHSQNRKHSRSSPSEATALTSDTSSEVDDSDPEVRRLIKRARKDSRSLIIQPGDDEKEEEMKMRANVDLIGTAIDEEDIQPKNSQNAEENVDFVAGDEASRPTEATPIPLMDKLGEQEEHEAIPLDPGDEEDIEPKEGDDYDVGNYEKFEDDDEVESEVEGAHGLGGEV